MIEQELALAGRRGTASPTASIIVPNYNHARFLPRRIGSILNQTFRDFEVILLDDASTDNSREVIAPFLADSRVSFHPSERNSGSPFVQWNRGVALARGEFVWIAESDDYAEPGLLETLVNLLRCNPNVGLACCQSHKVDENGCTHGTMESFTADIDAEHWRHPFISNGREECARYLLWKNTIPNASAVVFRREVFLRSGGAPTHLRLTGDWLTWVRMLLRSDQAFVPEPLNYFRHHTQTVRSKTPGREFFDESWAVRRFISRKCRLDAMSLRKLTGTAMGEFYARLLGVSPERRWQEARAGLRQFGSWFALHPIATARVVAAHRPFGRLGRALRGIVPKSPGKR